MIHNETYLLAIRTAVEASEILMEFYTQGFETEVKMDGSPVTNADKASAAHILSKLKQTNIPVLDEEHDHEQASLRKNWTQNWCVDPLDGTKEFIKKNGEFAVNIALIENSAPIFGVITSPVKREVIAGSREFGVYCFSFETVEHPELWTKIEANSAQNYPLRMVDSRSHPSAATQNFVKQLTDRFGEFEIIHKGSSLKFFDLAKQNAIVYPRFAPTMEWDIAAGQAILEALGGKVLDAESLKSLTYNKQDLRNPYFIAVSNYFLTHYDSFLPVA